MALQNKKSEYKVIGLMSGTSLDGVDLACCRYFIDDKGQWKFKILEAATYEYTDEWKSRLNNLSDSKAEFFVKTHADLGVYFGELINTFILKYHLTPELISSHGHTIFHQPGKGFTCQIGQPSGIAAITGIETAGDFRSKDVSLGGQGAPLVPVGDKLLFSEFDFCLNLGGIANISFDKNNKRLAFDICPANMALNSLAAEENMLYDKDGMLAESGNISVALLRKLNALPFYKNPPPKSLGKEWYSGNFESLVSNSSIALKDRLCTACEHIAIQIAHSLKWSSHLTEHRESKKKMLITGGGAHNKFLMSCIENQIFKNNITLVIPSLEIINFKEAVIFGFLGLLRKLNLINVLSSVTGASRDHVGGALYAAK